jgi:hypothetical protein
MRARGGFAAFPTKPSDVPKFDDTRQQMLRR